MSNNESNASQTQVNEFYILDNVLVRDGWFSFQNGPFHDRFFEFALVEEPGTEDETPGELVGIRFKDENTIVTDEEMDEFSVLLNDLFIFLMEKFKEKIEQENPNQKGMEND